MPDARERRRRAMRAVREARQRRALQRDVHTERVVGSLTQLQQQIRDELQGQPSDFDAVRLRRLLGEVDEHVRRWELRAKGLLGSALEEAWALGPDLVDAPFSALEANVARTLLPGSLLDELLAEGVELMDGVGGVARRRIHGALELGLLGGKTPADVMREISGDLRGPGPFRLIAFRAEAVTRTEMGRVHSKAGQRRLEDAARHVVGLGKQWIWSGKGRPSHRAANGQVRAPDEPFDVGGETLQYPRDAAGSPANTVFCACESVPWHPRW